jgi:hypothetical protein
MDAIDRLGWASGSSYSIHGLRVGLRVSDAALLPALEARLPPGWTRRRHDRVDVLLSAVAGGRGPTGSRRFHLLYVDAARLCRVLERDAFLEAFATEVEGLLTARARSRVFLHAGVVAFGTRAIVIPGSSGAGKSTLVAALVRAGGRYYSDEYAVLDARGRVHAYPRPLRLRRAGGSSQRSTLRARTRRRSLPVALVAFAPFRPGVEGWRPGELSGGRALLELLRHAVAVRSDPARTLSVLRAASAGARVLWGPRGEAEAAAQALLRQLENRPRSRPRAA